MSERLSEKDLAEIRATVWGAKEAVRRGIDSPEEQVYAIDVDRLLQEIDNLKGQVFRLRGVLGLLESIVIDNDGDRGQVPFASMLSLIRQTLNTPPREE